MTVREKLKAIQSRNQSRLCIGLDTDLRRLPAHLRERENAVLDFNLAVIEQCSSMACAFKINLAFYEKLGARGFEIVRETLAAIPDNIVSIADAKRGDIGNTSSAYAEAFFGSFGFDALTVSPYLGRDSVAPFLAYPDKLVFVLALTSNSGSSDIQRLLAGGKAVYQHVIDEARTWTDHDNIGFVVGATHPAELAGIRQQIPDSILLIPGVGAQGGDVAATMRANAAGPALVNVSRGILYADGDQDFPANVYQAARQFRDLIGAESAAHSDDADRFRAP